MALRVIMISHNFPHPAAPGETSFVARQVEHLSRAGVKIRVIAPVPSVPRMPAIGARMRRSMAASRRKPQQWQLHGVDVYYPRYVKLPGRFDFGLFGPLMYRGIRGLVRRLHAAEPCDLIHGQWLVPDGYAAALLARDLGVPAVSSERGYAARCPASGPRRIAMHRAISRVNQIVAVSAALAECVRQLGTPKRDIRVVYTGVDTEKFQPTDRTAARGALGLHPGRYIVCCARLEAIKQPLLLLEAFAAVAQSLPEARLVWVGDGAAREEFSAQAAQRGLADRVQIVGDVPHEDIPRWLAAADIVALASSSEGLPNALVEASASARPIVATRVGGVPEVVLDGETGLLVGADDAAGFSQALLRLLGDDKLAAQLGASGRRHVEQRFSWQTHVTQMLDAYQSVLTP